MFETCNSYETSIKSISIIDKTYAILKLILIGICGFALICLAFLFVWKGIPAMGNFKPYSFSEILFFFAVIFLKFGLFYSIGKMVVNFSPLFFKRMIVYHGLCKTIGIQVSLLILCPLVSYIFYKMNLNYHDQDFVLFLVAFAPAMILLVGEISTTLESNSFAYVNEYRIDNYISEVFIPWLNNLENNQKKVYSDNEKEFFLFLSKDNPFKLYVIPHDKKGAFCEMNFIQNAEPLENDELPFNVISLRYIKIDKNTVEYIKILREFKELSK